MLVLELVLVFEPVLVLEPVPVLEELTYGRRARERKVGGKICLGADLLAVAEI